LEAVVRNNMFRLIRSSNFDVQEDDAVNIYKGKLYPTAVAAREEVRLYCRQQTFAPYFRYNRSNLIEVWCKSMEGKVWPRGEVHIGEGMCPFRVVMRRPRYSNLRVTVADLDHADRCVTEAARIRRDEVKEVAREMLKHGDVRPHALMSHVRAVLRVECSYTVAREVLFELRNADPFCGDDGFQYMEDLLGKFKDKNPSSVVFMVRRGNHFYRAGIIFPGARDAVMNCLPIIFADGCHNKTAWGGYTLNICMLDSQHKLVMLGCAWVEGENKHACAFLFNLLLEAVPEVNSSDFVMMHDRGGAWISATSTCLPLVRESFCITHLVRNFKKFRTDLDGRILAAAAALTELVYLKTMEKNEMECPGGSSYLVDNGLGVKWATAYFGAPRYGCLSSNPVESHHASLSGLRDKSPPQVLLGLADKLSTKIEERRQLYSEMTVADFPPRTKPIVIGNRDEGKRYRVAESGEHEYIVRQGDERRVVTTNPEDPADTRCSCGYT
ncbi:unnamed protein product, partial [Closterium sp. Naga37s-1]